MWGKEKRFAMIGEPRIAAIYFGLMQSGYEYYSAGKIQEDVRMWEAWAKLPVSYDVSFLKETRQVTAGIYPFASRAAALEMAAFFVDAQNGVFSDEETCLRKIHVSDILKERETADFQGWVKGFPKVLRDVMHCEGFGRYIQWEEHWRRQQTRLNRGKLQKYDDVVSYFIKKYDLSVQNISVVYCPLKCAYASDYLVENGTLYAISGVLRLEAVLREFLRLLVHPFILKHSDAITSLRNLHRLRVENANYGDKTDQAKLNTFEAYTIQELMVLIEENRYKVELEKFLPSLIKPFS